MNKNSFFLNGYFIIKKALSKSLISEMQNTFALNDSKKLSYAKCYKKFLNNIKKNKKNNYDFTKPFHEISIFKNYYKKIFLSKKIYKKLTELLGPDLAYLDDPSFTINISNILDSKKNYHFKKWHQEIWSGSDTSTISLWSPIFLPSNKSGQTQFIKDSHFWGHVPNNNRAPIILPKKYETIKINLNIGDVVIFHPLLLHGTSPIKTNNFSARLALVSQIRNFKNKNSSYDLLKDWKIFSMSDLTLIEKKLGNHYLSPYRTKKLD